MSKAPEWPSYSVGPKDSIFAIGVVSVKFAELESILIFIFATVMGVHSDIATKTAAKIGSGPCLQLTIQLLETTGWSENIKDLVGHFGKAVSICMENRNHLIHSNVATLTSSDETVLYKTSKQGNTIMAVPKLAELQLVADDMNLYTQFGRQLGNAINGSLAGTVLFSNGTSPFPWPDKPPLPHTLTYTSDLHPLSKDRPNG